MSTESILEKIKELTDCLEQRCTLAMNETDSAKQSEISLEIHRVVDEKRRLENRVDTH